MAHAFLWCSLFLFIFVNYSQGQQSSSFQDSGEIIFPGPTERPPKYPLSTTTPQPSAAYTQCFNSCPATSEYNPVCGTDNVVYSNPGRLGCAQNCGKQVEIRRYGQCTDNSRGSLRVFMRLVCQFKLASICKLQSSNYNK